MWFIPPSPPAMDKKSANDTQEKIMSSIAQIQTVMVYSLVLVLTSMPSFHWKAVIWSQSLFSLTAVGGNVPSCKILTCREKARDCFQTMFLDESEHNQYWQKTCTNCFCKDTVLLGMWMLSLEQALCYLRRVSIHSKLTADRQSICINCGNLFLRQKAGVLWWLSQSALNQSGKRHYCGISPRAEAVTGKYHKHLNLLGGSVCISGLLWDIS